MIVSKIVTYSGQAPTIQATPGVEKLFDLFKQQNEILRIAMGSIALVAEGTSISVKDIPTSSQETP